MASEKLQMLAKTFAGLENILKEEMIGMIITLEGNDLTQGRENNYYAVSHPRFIELRNDKDYTDTLERAFESLELAKMFKERE